jgi:hypothetical protein
MGLRIWSEINSAPVPHIVMSAGFTHSIVAFTQMLDDSGGRLVAWNVEFMG